ncbi:phage baseplate assembly protein V [Sulfurovum sp.]|uniref:phage baseplate assembly protein V n=1 Tax=Sulfurovum sp. TaxID=1969726 RepID=UPI0025E8C846|nr:phage baseplate assembly protein V [Sulfurovum sp.]
MNPLNPNSDYSENTRNLNGISSAIVTNNKDPDGLGRIKIRYVWDQDNYETTWARVMSFMAGDHRGGFFLPEVGDEVLVGFIEGIFEFPVILGAVWNGKDIPPAKNENGKNDIKKIRTRSGHEIIFDDHESNAKLEIKSKSGHKISLNDAAGGEKMSIEDKNGNRIEIDAVSNTITLKSSIKLSLEANMIDIKADGILTLQGGLVKIN